jgi:hypothetical protein
MGLAPVADDTIPQPLMGEAVRRPHASILTALSSWNPIFGYSEYRFSSPFLVYYHARKHFALEFPGGMGVYLHDRRLASLPGKGHREMSAGIA